MRIPFKEDRFFKSFTLDNSLQVLLISDPNADKSSAAMDVHVGSFMDPPDLPGLAHFLEHLLFMGTEKYPDENEYSEFLSKHGGHSNAYTSSVDTNYYFEVSSTHLDQALDRFSQFFISPLFKTDGVERELNAVDSEFKKGLASDSKRTHAVLQENCKPTHAFAKFDCGDVRSLRDAPMKNGIDVVGRLLEFYRMFYSANIMKLVVLGKEPLDTLQEWVTQKFSAIKNINAPLIEFNESPFDMDMFGKIILVQPIKEYRRISIYFPIDDQSTLWKCKPAHYVSHLIGHESEGSILSLLKRHGWATALSAGGGHSATGFDVFTISIDLTSNGLLHYEETIQIVFQYIDMLRKVGPLEWIYKESARIADIQFEFKEKNASAGFVSRTASDMHKYPSSYFFYGSYAMEDFDTGSIGKVVDCLRADNAVFLLSSKDFSGLFEKDTMEWKKEKWYGTDYAISHLSSEFVLKLKEMETNHDLMLPEPNMFLPENLSVNTGEVIDETPEKPNPPRLVHKDEILSLWYKKDQRFYVPKSNLFIMIKSPHAYISPYHTVMTKLYVELVKDSLTEYVYMAEIAGLNYSIEVHVDGISVILSGFTDKIFVLLGKIFDKLRRLKTDKNRFDIQLDKQIRNCKNWSREPSHQLVMYHATQAVHEVLFTPEEKLKELEFGDFSLEDVYIFIEDFFRHVHMEVLFHGSLDMEHVKSEIEKKKNLLCVPIRTIPEEHFVISRPIQRAADPKQRTVIIPPGDIAYILQSQDETNPNSAVEYMMYCGDAGDSETRVKVYLMRQMIHDPAFDQLRTKEQLGYVVWGTHRKAASFIALRIIIMGDYDTIHIENRIEAFLVGFKSEVLSKMTDEDFAKHRVSLRTSMTKKDENIMEESSRWWRHLVSGYFEFDDVSKDLACLDKLTKEDMLLFFDEYLAINAPQRRRLSTHVRSCAAPREIRDFVKEQPETFVSSLKDTLKNVYGISLTTDEFFVVVNNVIQEIDPSSIPLPLSEGKEADESQEIDSEAFLGDILKKVVEKVKTHQIEVLDKEVSFAEALISDAKFPFIQAGSYKLAKGCRVITETELLQMKENWQLSRCATPKSPHFLKLFSS